MCKVLKISSIGLALIKKWEGFQAKAYLCPAGVWTIGYGTTKWLDGKAVKKGDTITEPVALQLLERQVNEHAATIPTYVKRPLNQNQFDALASFQYNLGRHILNGNKTLVAALNNGDWVKATEQMRLYNKATNPQTGKKEILRGLDNRRKAEITLFLKTVQNESSQATGYSSPALEKMVNDIVKVHRERIVKQAVQAGLNEKVWMQKLKDNSITDTDIRGMAVIALLS